MVLLWYQLDEQKIKLTTTTDYYTNIIPTVSGATITTKGVENMVKYWFDLYQPLLQQLKEKL